MEKIKVKKDELLKILTKNRSEHRAIFEEAIENFRIEAIAQFEKNIQRAKARKPFEINLGMVQPIDQTKEYDRAIGMISMSVDDVISLSERDYQNYVQDDWAWSAMTLSSNSTYSPKGAAYMASKGY